jgi:hypothetical protein
MLNQVESAQPSSIPQLLDREKQNGLDTQEVRNIANVLTVTVRIYIKETLIVQAHPSGQGALYRNQHAVYTASTMTISHR